MSVEYKTAKHPQDYIEIENSWVCLIRPLKQIHINEVWLHFHIQLVTCPLNAFVTNFSNMTANMFFTSLKSNNSPSNIYEDICQNN